MQYFWTAKKSKIDIFSGYYKKKIVYTEESVHITDCMFISLSTVWLFFLVFQVNFFIKVYPLPDFSPDTTCNSRKMPFTSKKFWFIPLWIVSFSSDVSNPTKSQN